MRKPAAEPATFWFYCVVCDADLDTTHMSQAELDAAWQQWRAEHAPCNRILCERYERRQAAAPVAEATGE